MTIRLPGCAMAGLLACVAAGTAYALEAPPAGVGPSGSGDCSRHIAITLDDLPFADQRLSMAEQRAGTEALLQALKLHRVPAIGFVNEDKLLVDGEVSERIGLLRNWLNAGMTLGNHGFGHLDLQTTPLPEAEAAVLQGEVVTRWLMKQYGEAPR
ncbi:MAG TPA: polysaccharide deacetylase family protein, partial [Gammaproteobacteria bacterium]|nr:polysaccharide deacetylase family protein [Gammaproteobacteria bacterium]